MKAKTFENLIRKVVREEIDYALGRELKSLKEDLRSEFKPTITEEFKPPTVDTSLEQPKAKNSLKEKIMGKKPFIERSFVSDKALNNLLNETARGDTNTEKGSPSMDNSYLQTATPAVTEAITRDYSDLMGAILKK